MAAILEDIWGSVEVLRGEFAVSSGVVVSSGFAVSAGEESRAAAGGVYVPGDTTEVTHVDSDGREPRSEASVLSCLSDDRLLRVSATVADLQRMVQALSALTAGEVGRRSRPELGHDGLAWKAGFRTPERMMQVTAGVSGTEARKLVSVGMLAVAVGDEPSPSESGGSEKLADQAVSTGSEADRWDAPIGRALRAGRISPASAEAVRRGLGEPDESVDGTVLRECALRLLQVAEASHPDELWRLARNERDRVDAAGVAERERARREARYLKIWRRPDGMTRVDGLLDPESAAIVTSALDAVTSPRRGGPRFTQKNSIERAQRLVDDPRTTDQITLDTFVEMVQLAVGKDNGAIFGSLRPTVKLIVTAEAAVSGTGVAQIEGQPDPVGAATIERHLCGGEATITVDSRGRPLNLGRDSRLFSRAQREAMAVRDGGCMWPGCDRPPDWCEAHHINEWFRHDGRTDIADGVLLCRTHHLRLHDESWRIVHDPSRPGCYRLHSEGSSSDGSDDYLLHSRTWEIQALQGDLALRVEHVAVRRGRTDGRVVAGAGGGGLLETRMPVAPATDGLRRDTSLATQRR